MNEKDYLTNRAFCPIPWTGIMYNFDGTVKNCIRSSGSIGNLNNNTIDQIINGTINVTNKESMISGIKVNNCQPCYNLEQKNNQLDIISDRVFYLKELKSVDKLLYKNKQNFELHTIDIRWSNLCNFSCVYCGPEFSSKWANELGVQINTPPKNHAEQFKEYIFSNLKKLKHVYLAGGEPLLIKENLELLEKLYIENPNINLRINTNLSKVDTQIFELICKFKNVHWTVSVETIEEEYDYIRYGGNWYDFIDNLTIIKNLNHKISFNMLYFLFNFLSLFKCIDFLKSNGFHNNSFIIGALSGPTYLDVRHLPDATLDDIDIKLQKLINESPGYLLENSYKNLLHYIRQPMIKNLANSFKIIKTVDERRNLDSKLIFKDLYQYER